jgi:hypothetical protein
VEVFLYGNKVITCSVRRKSLGVELLMVEAYARVMDNLGSLGAALPGAGFHYNILITFTYSPVEVMLKLINALPTVKLLAHEFILSHVVV